MADPANGGWPPLCAAPVALTAARFPKVATRTPDLDPGSVPAARSFTRATLQRWGVTEVCDDITVVMSELLTNALHHALPAGSAAQHPRPIRLGLMQPGPCVLCAVADPSDQAPVLREPDYLAESGRGLHVVASLSSGWGWTAPGRAGKVVWAMFSIDAPAVRLSGGLFLSQVTEIT
jgi:anti-sigma regulatory factor (Ser/Thr protein kinase)